MYNYQKKSIKIILNIGTVSKRARENQAPIYQPCTLHTQVLNVTDT